MTFRYFELLLLILLGAVGGIWANSMVWVLVGALGGASCWYALDAVRLDRILTWMRQGNWTSPPEAVHVWRTVVAKIFRIQKSWNQINLDSQARLNEFLAAMQASPNGVVLLDSALRIEWCNQTAADHLGLDPVRDLMQHITNLVRDPDFTQYIGQSDFSSEIQISGAGASASKPVRVSIQLHPYAQHRKLMLTRDVTTVEQAEAMRRDFVANVSHEIRTPLTVLSGFVETLQNLPLTDSERDQYLVLMWQQAERMQVLVSDLLTLSKLEGSPTPTRQNWLLASSLVERCVRDAHGLCQALRQAERQIVFDAEAGLDFEVAGIQGELTSALSNLLSNAIRYSPAESPIWVSSGIQANGGGAWFSVKDAGPGIAAEHIPRLTERFYRVDRSRSRETGGTGLGLAIVKHVIQRHGGSLVVHSELGKGAQFTLRIPADRMRLVGGAAKRQKARLH